MHVLCAIPGLPSHKYRIRASRPCGDARVRMVRGIHGAAFRSNLEQPIRTFFCVFFYVFFCVDMPKAQKKTHALFMIARGAVMCFKIRVASRSRFIKLLGRG